MNSPQLKALYGGTHCSVVDTANPTPGTKMKYTVLAGRMPRPLYENIAAQMARAPDLVAALRKALPVLEEEVIAREASGLRGYIKEAKDARNAVEKALEGLPA